MRSLRPFLRAGRVLTALLFSAHLRAGNLEDVVSFDWGPVAARWVDVHTNTRTRVLGPLVEHMSTTNGWSFTAVRPLYSTWGNPEQQVRGREFLWPLAESKRAGKQFSWRVLLTYFHDWDTENPKSKWHLWSLPFYFQGRSAAGEAYFALFPLGGTIRDFLTYDRISFVLWPLHVTSQQGQTTARTWLWPLISHTTGPNVERVRVFPFYGSSRYKDDWQKTFILWPFWTSVRYNYPQSNGEGWILFPVTGHLKLTDQETWWVVPPLFRYSTGDGENRLYGPWPFFQRSRNEDEAKLYIWPLWGRKNVGSVVSSFFLWPLGSTKRVVRTNEVKTHFNFLPFIQVMSRYAQPTDAEEQGELQERLVKLWPLYSDQVAGDRARFRLLDLYPTRDSPVERNYAPFWQWVNYDRVGEHSDTEVLWGVYRSVLRGEDLRYRSIFPLASWSSEPGGSHFSLLKGLIGYRTLDSRTQWRILWLFRIGRLQEDPHD